MYRNTRFTEHLRRINDANTKDALESLTKELYLRTGVDLLNPQSTQVQNFAGGTNYCPNSAFSYSTMAMTTAGTLPSTAGDTNHECYKFYRQLKSANITKTANFALKATSHSLYTANEGANAYIPIWNRSNGCLVFGSADALNQYDVAVNLYGHYIRPAMRWYVHFELEANTADVVPSDLQMYCGIWHKTATMEGWISGTAFNLDYDIVGTKGTKTLEYKVIAKTDGNVQIESNVLVVNDAPNTINANNFPRIKYDGVQGFIEFELYRRDGTQFAKIASIRNTNTLSYDDSTTTNDVIVAKFPDTISSTPQALAQSTSLGVGINNVNRIINSFTIQIPSNYNHSATLPFEQYLRFGFTVPTAVNRQIILDRIWLSTTYNNWADSPLDNTQNVIMSTSQSSGVGNGGGGIYIPPNLGGGGLGGGDLIEININ